MTRRRSPQRAPAKTQPAKVETPPTEALSRVVRAEIRQELTQIRVSHFPESYEAEGWERLVPGAADRILTRWERQGEHRQGLENRVIDADIRSARNGLILGFILEIAALILAAILAFTGREVAGSIIGAAGLLSLSGTTIYVMIRRGKERQERFQQLTTPIRSRRQ